MKLFSAVLFAASAHHALSAKVASKVDLRSIHKTDGYAEKAPDSFCPAGVKNRYPASMDQTYTFASSSGLATNQAAGFDKTKLQEALTADSDWNIQGVQWILQAKFTSDSQVDRVFGFAGGDTDGSTGGHFLTITVPAGVQNKTIKAEAVPATPGDNAEFQYISHAAYTSGPITMSEICLAPQTCASYLDSCPVGEQKKTGVDLTLLVGDKESTCCESIMCKDTVSCEPSTKYEQMSNFESKKGHDKDGCCNKKSCPVNGTCEPASQYSKKTGTGILGSTKDECCQPKTCDSYVCTDAALWVLKNVTDLSAILGSTDEECCEARHCSVFDCEGAGEWVKKENASEIQGDSTAQCCDPKLCHVFDCGDEALMSRNTNAVQGNTTEECCIRRRCVDYLTENGRKCQSDKLKPKFGETPGAMGGSSDEQCCEPLTCEEYLLQTKDKGKCEQHTMWLPLPTVYADNNTDRIGFSDEECCSKKMCTSNLCDPSTKWQPKTDVETIQGSTQVMCCDYIYCANFTCDTDDDGDGVGTQWIKKRDTNHFKFQGSTDEECCTPLYCSQYTTDDPRLWKRKKNLDGTLKRGLLGSSDYECYDPKLCSDYCCIDDLKGLRNNASEFMGDSDAECCVLKTVLAPAAAATTE